MFKMYSFLFHKGSNCLDLKQTKPTQRTKQATRCITKLSLLAINANENSNILHNI